jgi:aminoglycoside phosphotransferase (APT) family kinase protein
MADPGLKLPHRRALALVPGAGAEGAGVHAVVVQSGGSVNDLWRVDTAAGSFLLRQDGPAWRRPGIDREHERVAHAAAAAAGIAPPIVARTASGDVQVSAFIPGRVWTAADLELPAQRERLCALLGRVHRLPWPAPSTWPFEPLRLATDYAQRAGQPAGALLLLQAARHAGDRLQAASAPRVLTHGDALAGNVIDAGGRLWLIDWEFTQCADPVWDLAAFAAWSPAAAADLPRCAAAAGIAGGRLAERLDAALALHRALGGLWYLARGEAPPTALETGAGSGQTSRPL